MSSEDEKPAVPNGKDVPATPADKKTAAHSIATKVYIVSALTNSDISQADLSKKMGIPRSTIGAIFNSAKGKADTLGVELWDEGAYDAGVKIDKSAVTPTPKRKRGPKPKIPAANGSAEGAADEDGEGTPSKTPRKKRTPAKPKAKKDKAAADGDYDSKAEDKSGVEAAAVKMDDEHDDE